MLKNIFNILLKHKSINYVHVAKNSEGVTLYYKFEKYIGSPKYSTITEIEIDIYNDYYWKIFDLYNKYVKKYN